MPDTPDSLFITGDGSRTAFSRRFEQAYSSIHGARTQSENVFVRATGTDTHPSPRVLEVGFGLGHNFTTTLAMRPGGSPLEYLAFEFDPAPKSTLASVSTSSHPAWLAALDAWGSAFAVREGPVMLEVRVEDVTSAELPEAWATAIYLDGFSPAVNPAVWTPEMCARLAGSLMTGGVLATYSAAGHVRRSVLAAGLQVEKRRGTHGKREHLVAIKP